MPGNALVSINLKEAAAVPEIQLTCRAHVAAPVAHSFAYSNTAADPSDNSIKGMGTKNAISEKPILPSVRDFTFKIEHRSIFGNVLVLSWVGNSSNEKAILSEGIGIPVSDDRNNRNALPLIKTDWRDVPKTRCFQKGGKSYMEINSLRSGWHVLSLGLFAMESGAPAASTHFFCRIPEPDSLWKNLLRGAGWLLLIVLILFWRKLKRFG
jgi:hypothetical protein